MSKEKDDSSKKGEGEVSHKYTLEDYLDLEEKLKAAGDQKEGDSGTKEEVEKIRLEPKVERFKDQLELSFEMRGIHEIVKAGNYPDSKEINTEVFINPGSSSSEEVADLFYALSDLNRACGGDGLLFISGSKAIELVNSIY